MKPSLIDRSHPRRIARRSRAQAAARIRQTIEHAEQLNNPVMLCIALRWAIAVFLWSGGLEDAEEHIDWLIAEAEFHSLGPYLAVGQGHKAELAIRRGDASGDVESLQRTLETLRVAHHELPTLELSASLAQGLVALSRCVEAITLIDETIRLVEEKDDTSYMPELLRVKGGLFLSMRPPNRDAAETSFKQSLEVSRRQGARALELRTAVDLAALWAAENRSEDARSLLQPVLEQFTEGFDTADLKVAERLLSTFPRIT